MGAILVQDNRVISTGYNGTAEKMENCDEGGCYRCTNRDQFESGTGYDLCICVHAEQNALLAAGRFGSTAEGSVLYTTTRPCFGCTKEALQAKVGAVFYMHDWKHPDAKVQHEYQRLQARFPNGMNIVAMGDDRKEWAQGKQPLDVQDTGHYFPASEGS